MSRPVAAQLRLFPASGRPREQRSLCPVFETCMEIFGGKAIQVVSVIGPFEGTCLIDTQIDEWVKGQPGKVDMALNVAPMYFFAVP